MNRRIRERFSLKKQIQDESGAVAVLVALLLTVLLMFTALAVDFGLLYMQESKLQTACDAAALAAATVYVPEDCSAETAARTRAKEIMKANGFDIVDSDVVFNAAEGTVQVKKKIDVKTTFASVMNINYMKAQKSAKAAIGGGKKKFQLDYALFSGSSTDVLPVNSSLGVYGGNAHTNNAVRYSIAGEDLGGGFTGRGGNSFAVEGYDFTSRKDAVNTSSSMQQPTNSTVVSEDVPMPDYHEAIMDVLPKVYVRYSNLEAYIALNPTLVSGSSPKKIKIPNNVIIEEIRDCNYELEVTGDLLVERGDHSNGVVFNQKVTIGTNGGSTGSIYVKDSVGVTFKNIEVCGYVVADNNITIGNIMPKGYPKNSIIYPINGNLEFVQRGANIFYGLIYVPNGYFYMRDEYSLSVYGGGIIVDHIRRDNGGSLAIFSEGFSPGTWDDDLKLPSSSGGRPKLVE